MVDLTAPKHTRSRSRQSTHTNHLTNPLPNQLDCFSSQGANNQVVDLTVAQYAMPPSGQTSYTKLKYILIYDTTIKCGFQELCAAQEWGELQFAVRFTL